MSGGGDGCLSSDRRERWGRVIFVAAWLTSSDRQLTDSVIACMGDELLLGCTCGGRSRRELGQHGRPSRCRPRKQTLISHTGSFCGGSHLDDDAVVGRVGHLVAREDDVGITVELPGVGTGGGSRGQRVGSDVDAGSTRWRGGTIGTGTHIRTMFPKVWSSFCTT